MWTELSRRKKKSSFSLSVQVESSQCVCVCVCMCVVHACACVCVCVCVLCTEGHNSFSHASYRGNYSQILMKQIFEALSAAFAVFSSLPSLFYAEPLSEK